MRETRGTGNRWLLTCEGDKRWGNRWLLTCEGDKRWETGGY